MKRKIIILVLTSGMLVVSAAEAQAQSSASSTGSASAMSKREQAEQHLREGKLLMQQKKFEEASRAFASAYEEHPAYDIAMALGDVEKRLGHHAKAAKHLSYALKHLPLSASVKERDGLRKQMDEVRLQVGALVFEVSPAGAEVMLNGEPLGATHTLELPYFTSLSAHPSVAQCIRFFSCTFLLTSYLSAPIFDASRKPATPGQKSCAT